MGPGIVVVLTWLGAGDLVDASVAGGLYGYALMWVLALALLVRWLFVSLIARYHLCNERRESVMQGLGRLSPLFPPFIFLSTLLLSHVIGIYMYLGLSEACAALAGGGPAWAWSLGWATLFYFLLARPVFRRVEQVFLVFLALLSVSLIGAAAWSRPDPLAILRGTIGFALPEQQGAFEAHVVAVSLVGAVAGSLANLMYPYFLREKGWNSPEYLRVQKYDLALGILVIIILDLAVWVLGAEVLHGNPAVDPHNLGMTDIARVLDGLGHAGFVLFYLGVFGAVGSSIVGNALAYSSMAVHAFLLWRRHPEAETAYRTHPGYRRMVVWCLFSPIVWVLTGRGDFVPLTVLVNAFQVLLLPLLAMGLWRLTASPGFIGERYRNTVAQNAGMAVFVLVALLGAAGSAQSLLGALGRLLASR